MIALEAQSGTPGGGCFIGGRGLGYKWDQVIPAHVGKEITLVVELLRATTQEKAMLTRNMKARKQLEGTSQPQPELELSGPPDSQAPLGFVHLSLHDQEEKVFVSSIPPPVPRIIYIRALLSCSAFWAW